MLDARLRARQASSVASSGEPAVDRASDLGGPGIAAAEADASSPAVYVDASQIEAYANLIAPMQVSPGKVFTVALTVDANMPLHAIGFDLLLGAADLDVVTLDAGPAFTANGQRARFKYQRGNGAIHVDLSQPGGAQPHGVLALFQLKFAGPHSTPVTLRIDKFVARNQDGYQAVVAPTAARQVVVQ